jgi:hypothetical protein
MKRKLLTLILAAAVATVANADDWKDLSKASIEEATEAGQIDGAGFFHHHIQEAWGISFEDLGKLAVTDAKAHNLGVNSPANFSIYYSNFLDGFFREHQQAVKRVQPPSE